MKLTPLDSLPPPIRLFLAAARERWRAITAFVMAVAAVSAVVAMLLPSWYRAQATVLPPTEGNDAFGVMSGLVQAAALTRVGLTTTTTASDVYSEILRSRLLQEDLVRTFDLERRYHRKGMDRTLKVLAHHLKIETSNTGLLIAQVEDRDPRRAADMANRLVDGLDRFNRQTLNTRAKRTREFLAARVADVRQRLRAADSVLTVYEQRHGVVADASSVAGLASLIAQKFNLQVKREYISSFSNEGASAVRAMDAEIAAYDQELARLPGLKNTGARLALDAEIQRRVLTLLSSQYEEARVQEMRDTPTITILDRARSPELRARPKRTLIVLCSTALALLLAGAWVALSIRGTETA